MGKLIQSLDTVTECILLLNNGAETAWAQNLATVASSVCFPAGRTTFERCDDNSPGKSGKPMQGQIIVYLGPNPDLFENTYQTYGWCARIRHEKKTKNIPDNIIRNNPSLEETD